MKGSMKKQLATKKHKQSSVPYLSMFRVIFEFLLRTIYFDQFIETNDVENVLNVFVGPDDDQLTVLFLEHIMTINQDVKRSAVEIGYLGQVQGDFLDVFLKKSIDM
jgi:hypothetical protein